MDRKRLSSKAGLRRSSDWLMFLRPNKKILHCFSEDPSSIFQCAIACGLPHVFDPGLAQNLSGPPVYVDYMEDLAQERSHWHT